ncbi:hypothetical protein GCM10014715_13930 [Streptomyces spiralis]|uniref:Uncharacterized protein n=1 Tax=Streptomyces spiralis TaxID=66376 RepID=A0A918ZQ67_9ACTN|nr:hypothetical protein GCM10014715_13930 [Streptomyces spiralis]
MSRTYTPQQQLLGFREGQRCLVFGSMTTRATIRIANMMTNQGKRSMRRAVTVFVAFAEVPLEDMHHAAERLAGGVRGSPASHG